jgi:hypothetical protein
LAFLAALSAAAPALADPAPAARASDTAPAETSATAPTPPDPILAYYPPAALAAHIDGDVTLMCERTLHGGFANCELEGETPAGQGFGAAAFALVGKAVECPTLSLSAVDQLMSAYRFVFSASASMITPDVLNPDWPIVGQDDVRRPRNLAAPLPPAAAQANIHGVATMECEVTPKGRMSDCRVVEEKPAGYGLGEATLKLADNYSTEPRTNCAGQFVPTTLRVSVAWGAPRGR